LADGRRSITEPLHFGSHESGNRRSPRSIRDMSIEHQWRPQRNVYLRATHRQQLTWEKESAKAAVPLPGAVEEVSVAA
jgi:hypothetical protein